jgi:hypothetical protein
MRDRLGTPSELSKNTPPSTPDRPLFCSSPTFFAQPAMPRKSDTGDAKSITTDPRFSRLHTDPRFIRPKKKANKVVVDERFKELFQDDQATGTSASLSLCSCKSFSANCGFAGKVDKYGRKLGKDHSRQELRRFYRLDDDDKESSGPSRKPDYARGEVLMSSSDESGTDDDEEEEATEASEDESETEEVTFGRRRRKASSEVSVDLDEEAQDQTRHADESASVQATRRLAIVNLDWDHVRAIDIYKVLSSVLSPTAPDAALLPPPVVPNLDKGEDVYQRSVARIAKGRLLSVTILPSEFGKQRLAKEEIEGPPKEIFKRKEESDDEEEIDETTIVQEDEGVEYDDRALRKYQLERLRYASRSLLSFFGWN